MYLKKMLSVLLPAVILLWQADFVFAQPAVSSLPAKAPFVLGSVETLTSVVLGETRTLNIYLPPDYAGNDSLSYPVVYLLDGSAHEDFVHIAGLMQFMNLYDLFPRSIIVGIANVDRKRDFTYPTSIAEDKKTYPTTGGSAAFITFIAEELQPFIEGGYRTNGSRTLIGQSLGGLLATEIFYKQPHLFDQYIIISPSLWWNRQSLLALPLPELKSPVRVFVGVGKEWRVMRRDARHLARLLRKMPANRMNSRFEYFPKEDHATILHRAVYRAFEFLKSPGKG